MKLNLCFPSEIEFVFELLVQASGVHGSGQWCTLPDIIGAKLLFQLKVLFALF